jgi:hypothetical protein
MAASEFVAKILQKLVHRKKIKKNFIVSFLDISRDLFFTKVKTKRILINIDG